MRRQLWMVLAAALAVGCGPGLCEGTGGIVDECKQGWDRSECEAWDTEEVNGASWEFHGSGTCEGLGYTAECSDGSWLLPEDAGLC